MHQHAVAQQQVADLQMTVKQLQAQMLAGKTAKLSTANQQLRHDISQLQTALQTSQVSEAQARAEAVHASQMQAMLKATAEANARAAQEAASEALAAVDKAKKSDDVHKAAAEEAAMDAESNQLTKCSEIWDSEHASLLQELDRCKAIPGALATAHAKVASLSGTV